MIPTLKHLDELEKKATQETGTTLAELEAHMVAVANFKDALVNFWRSEEGRQMREDADNAAYYRWKLKAIIPLFEEARGGNWCLSHGLIDRMSRAGNASRADFDAARGEDK